MKLRIMRDGHGKFFIQRKFLWWWNDVCEPENEFSDATITFNTVEDAERYAAYINGFYVKPTFVKNACAIAEEGAKE